MMTTTGALKVTKMIPFDGAYWYFKWPDTRPAPNASVTQGDPVRKRIFRSDDDNDWRTQSYEDDSIRRRVLVLQVAGHTACTECKRDPGRPGEETHLPI